jgi:hypothetical protein
LGEKWLEEDIFNALTELTYFRRAFHQRGLNSAPAGKASPFPHPPDSLILPTTFLVNAREVYQSSAMPIYTKEILALRERIQTTTVRLIAMSLVADNHFTAFVYRPGSVSIEYGDSMHHQPPGDIIPVLQWIFHGLFETSISEINLGFIPKQGPGKGEGSCGVIAHNFIEIAVEAHPDGVRRWNGSESALFRNAILQDLISFHYAATQSAGDFSAWTSPILSPRTDGLKKGQVNISTGSGFNDFNNFSPNVSYFS